MDSKEFKSHLIEIKKEKFKEIVRLSANKIGLENPPPIQFWDGVCPFDTGVELAHIHVDSGIICVSRLKLEQMTLEDIEEVATHEVTHLIDLTHNPTFYEKQDEIKIGIWKPDGVVVIVGGSNIKEKKQKKKVKIDKIRCNYHLCRKKTKLTQCPYCKGYFCEENLNPKLPGGYSEDGRRFTLLINQIETKEESEGHPCAVYVSYMEQQKKKEEERYRKALKELTKKRKEEEEVPSSIVSIRRIKRVAHKKRARKDRTGLVIIAGIILVLLWVCRHQVLSFIQGLS